MPQLFAHFVHEALEQMGQPSFTLTDSIRRRLLEHEWPGNVRELRNFAFAAVLNPTPQDSREDTEQRSLSERVECFEASVLRDTLVDANGDIRATMAQLVLPRKTLYDKLSRHGIDPNDFRPKR